MIELLAWPGTAALALAWMIGGGAFASGRGLWGFALPLQAPPRCCA